MKIDYLIVGAGLYGATFARQATDLGKKCLVIDRRTHIGGNVYSENVHGVEVHKYGPHIFHTNSAKIWDYVNQFAEFNDYKHKVLSSYDNVLYSFPINLTTLEQLWGISDDNILTERFFNLKSEHQGRDNLEDWAIAEVGEEIYRKFIYGYTKKHWGVEPAALPSSIISRIPVRTDRNDQYHNAKFSGIPLRGYTDMVRNMLDGIDTVLGADYLKNRDYWDAFAKQIVYTGSIDDFFDYEHGELGWRSLRFEEEVIDIPEYQPVAQINYSDLDIPYTRIVEYKHFNQANTSKTVITREYPQKYSFESEKFYPVNDDFNNSLYGKYKKMTPKNFIFGGRLAQYRYYDMHQVIGAALKIAENAR